MFLARSRKRKRLSDAEEARKSNEECNICGGLIPFNKKALVCTKKGCKEKFCHFGCAGIVNSHPPGWICLKCDSKKLEFS